MAKLTVTDFVAKSLTLLEKERAAEIDETRVLQEQLPLKELQRQGVCLLKLHIASRHTGLYGRTILQLELYGEGKELPSNKFTPGDIAGLSLSQGGTSQAEQLCSGIVTRVTSKAVSVAFDESYDQLDLDDTAQYKIAKLANDVTYRRVKKALGGLDQHNHAVSGQLVSVLFGESEPGPPYSEARDGKQHDIVHINQSLDDSQQEAVRFALQQREVAIIHGPPGTGKTTTVTEIILQAVKQGLKLLVCAPSNIAVDNLTEKLSQYKARMVRIGHPARVLPTIQAYSLDAVLRNSDAGRLVEDVRKDMDQSLTKLKRTSGRGERQRLKDDMKHLRKELRTREDKAMREVLQGVDIVLATLTMATLDGPLRHVDKKHFDLVVIDECSQALEAACWIVLQQGPRCILAGDHNQLPPTILSHEAAKEGLSLTLMERLLNLHGNLIMRMLTTQYRMHEDIMTWPSQQLYDGKLTAHESVAKHLISDLPGVTDTNVTSTPVLLIDTAGCNLEELRLPGDLSKGNEGEADIVMAHVHKLVESGLKAEDIAVIAPYNLQVELLRLRLSHKYPKLEIKSVDGFQGREKEAVIISLVRSNDKGEVGFLAEDRRINVAITRARRHLVVVCDTDTVSKHGFLKSLVEYMTETGDVTSAQEYIQAGALDTDFKRPEYLDEQIDRQKQTEGATADKTSQSQHPSADGKHVRSTKTRLGGKQSQRNKDSAVNKDGKTANTTQPAQDLPDNTEYIQKAMADLMLNDAVKDFTFPTFLSGKDRKMVHEMCENLGLQHESRGEGSGRHIVVSKTKTDGSREQPTRGGMDQNKASTSSTKQKPQSSLSNTTDQRTNSTNSSGNGAVSSKPNSVQTPSKDSSESGSDQNCVDLAEKTESLLTQTDIASAQETVVINGSEEIALKHCSLCGKDIPKANFELHQLRCRGAVDTTNENVSGAKSKKSKSKSAKKKPGGTSSASATKPMEEDFDTLIDQAIKDNKSCHYHRCKNSTATLGQNCQFCSRRFCLSHHIAESHGCGDSAKAHARVTISREGKLYRGSGVPDKKPDANRRAQLQRKLDNKLSDMADKRKIKKKEK